MQVREEQLRLRPDLQATITGDVLNQMTYSRQVVKEVLRYRPPAPMVPQVRALCYADVLAGYTHGHISTSIIRLIYMVCLIIHNSSRQVANTVIGDILSIHALLMHRLQDTCAFIMCKGLNGGLMTPVMLCRSHRGSSS